MGGWEAASFAVRQQSGSLEFPYGVWEIFGAFANLEDSCTEAGEMLTERGKDCRAIRRI